MPCFQSDLRDSTFFRIIGPQYTPRRAIYALEDPSEEGAQVKTITITQSVGGHDLTIYAAKFIPTPEDKVAYIWTDSDGNQQSMPMPHYCITCIPEITRNIMQYITRSKWSYIEMLKKSDPLAWKTLSMASQYARNKVTRYCDMREFEGYFHTAKMLLSRFHFVCNGSAPLRSKWTSPETLLLAKLQSHEIEFMGETQVEILRRETELLQLREKHKYESDLYWCQQMFFDNWDSGSPNIEDEVF
ncbi:hypothetical protein UCRPA7_8443 [Phaeoacremonium minimum UCRPA7]|uniref:Uncharacterized protein n=1 Tax=Phaeoacremonium minimum (strain UCR-PA7) TaxID=1286976 RepID=R8B9U3_PHAM7|nr:hypothetical protein UCRPA7_8443 [Phaeoacremonium minimum UCRPA7]EON96084.1 hypothetical protein UCRPA7_8443 [Phaeoacremonium minimum UCRPA7]